MKWNKIIRHTLQPRFHWDRRAHHCDPKVLQAGTRLCLVLHRWRNFRAACKIILKTSQTSSADCIICSNCKRYCLAAHILSTCKISSLVFSLYNCIHCVYVNAAIQRLYWTQLTQREGARSRCWKYVKYTKPMLTCELMARVHSICTCFVRNSLCVNEPFELSPWKGWVFSVKESAHHTTCLDFVPHQHLRTIPLSCHRLQMPAWPWLGPVSSPFVLHEGPAFAPSSGPSLHLRRGLASWLVPSSLPSSPPSWLFVGPAEDQQNLILKKILGPQTKEHWTADTEGIQACD